METLDSNAMIPNKNCKLKINKTVKIILLDIKY